MLNNELDASESSITINDKSSAVTDEEQIKKIIIAIKGNQAIEKIKGNELIINDSLNSYWSKEENEFVISFTNKNQRLPLFYIYYKYIISSKEVRCKRYAEFYLSERKKKVSIPSSGRYALPILYFDIKTEISESIEKLTQKFGERPFVIDLSLLKDYLSDNEKLMLTEWSIYGLLKSIFTASMFFWKYGNKFFAIENYYHSEADLVQMIDNVSAVSKERFPRLLSKKISDYSSNCSIEFQQEIQTNKNLQNSIVKIVRRILDNKQQSSSSWVKQTSFLNRKERNQSVRSQIISSITNILREKGGILSVDNVMHELQHNNPLLNVDNNQLLNLNIGSRSPFIFDESTEMFVLKQWNGIFFNNSLSKLLQSILIDNSKYYYIEEIYQITQYFFPDVCEDKVKRFLTYRVDLFIKGKNESYRGRKQIK